MKKLISLILLTTLLIICFTSCENRDEQLIIAEPWVHILSYYDGLDLVQRVIYNMETKLTFVYDYYWEYFPKTGRTICKDFSVTIYDENGNIVTN